MNHTRSYFHFISFWCAVCRRRLSLPPNGFGVLTSIIFFVDFGEHRVLLLFLIESNGNNESIVVFI